MIFDLVTMLILAVAFAYGYHKGIIVSFFSVLGLLLGIICSLRLSGGLAMILIKNEWVSSGWALLISYLILFFGVWILVRLIGKALTSTAKAIRMEWLNGVIGGILYTFVAIVFWSSVVWILNRMQLIPPDKVAQSETYVYIEPLAPALFAQIGKLIPFVKDVFRLLEHFFDLVQQKLAEHVGTDR